MDELTWLRLPASLAVSLGDLSTVAWAIPTKLMLVSGCSSAHTLRASARTSPNSERAPARVACAVPKRADAIQATERLTPRVQPTLQPRAQP